MRYFTNTNGKHFKFWSICVEGAGYIVEFGRIGTNGTSRKKKFSSGFMAEAAADKKIAEKLGKGYVETIKTTISLDVMPSEVYGAQIYGAQYVVARNLPKKPKPEKPKPDPLRARKGAITFND